MPFSINLKSLRERANLTQEELAIKTGVSKSAISMYERGERFPSEQILELLADFFNVDMNMLLGKQTKSTYFLNPKTAEMAQAIYDNPELGYLFDAAKDASPEDLRMATEILQKFKHPKE